MIECGKVTHSKKNSAVKNIGKRSLLIFLLVTFVSMLAFSVSAVQLEEHYVEDGNIYISVPSDYLFFTLDEEEIEKEFEQYGLSFIDAEYIIEYISSMDAKAYAVSTDFSQEIAIVVENTNVPIEGFFDDFWKEQLKSKLASELELNGITDYELSVYEKNPNAVGFKVDINMDDMVYVRRYILFIDTYRVVVDFKNSKEFSAQDGEIIEEMVNTIRFGSSKNEDDTELIQTTDAFVYDDVEGEVTFTVPENWTQNEKSGNTNQFLDDTFTYHDNVFQITYGSANLLESVSQTVNPEYFKYTQQMTAESFSELFGDDGECEKLKYGENEFFIVYLEAGDSFGGISYPMNSVIAIHYVNEWQYMFAFYGTKNDKAYSDFEKILSSVNFKKEKQNSNELERFDFVSEEDGIRFVVPDNWFSETTNAFYCFRNVNVTDIIIFGSTEKNQTWRMGFVLPSGYREMTDKELTEAYADEIDGTVETVNNCLYVVKKIGVNEAFAGTVYPVETLMYFHFEGDRFYAFSTSAVKGSLNKDFISLVSSIEYLDENGNKIEHNEITAKQNVETDKLNDDKDTKDNKDNKKK